MSERIERFETDGTPSVTIRVPSGEVRIVAGDPGTLVIRLAGSESSVERYIVERRGGSIAVEPDQSSGWRGRWSTVRVLVEAGEPPEIVAKLTSGDLGAEIPLDGLAVDTASGDIQAGEVAGDVILKAASGDLRLGRIGGRLEASVASGDVTARSVAGSIRVNTASGDVRIGTASDDVTVKSASGDVDIDRLDGRSLDVKTLSGDIEVGIPAGRGLDVSLQTLSGKVKTEFPVGSDTPSSGDGRIKAVTVSGDIKLRGAG